MPVSKKSATCDLSHVLHCETLKTQRKAIQKKRRVILTSGVVLLLDNARPYTAVQTRALLEHFNWELFDRSPYSRDFAPSDYHLFTYLKNWFGSQRCNNTEDLMEGVETWLNSLLSDRDTKNLFSDTRVASVPAETTLRNSLSMHVFLYIIIFSLIVC
jgi:hypothetical protein